MSVNGNNIREIVCISCPVGCVLRVTMDKESIQVVGHQCKLGEKYGEKEVANPRRMLTTSIKVACKEEPSYAMLSVKTNADIPKDRLLDCLKVIKSLELTSPVNFGDIVVENILDLGVDVVATRQV